LARVDIDVAFLLDNGALYHIANGLAVVEFLITLYFKPGFKLQPYISTIGEALLSASVEIPTAHHVNPFQE
jgi:protein-S-isoprenylcysteine O-methyltransferase